MDKNLKKSYAILDLSYSATEKEIKNRKKEAIEILNSKKIKNYDVELQKIENAYNLIIENLKENGFPTEEDHSFLVSRDSLVGLGVTLFIVAILCICSCLLF